MRAYQALIDTATANDRITVIKFYSGWCRACKAMAPKFLRMADDFPQVEFLPRIRTYGRVGKIFIGETTCTGTVCTV